MPHESRDADASPLLSAWGRDHAPTGSTEGVTWWLAGGVAMMLWTGVAMLLTSA